MKKNNRFLLILSSLLGFWLAVSSAVCFGLPEEKPIREVPGYEWKPVERSTWDELPFYARMRLEKQAQIGDSVVWVPVRNDVEIGKLQADQIRQLGDTVQAIRDSHLADRFEAATRLAASSNVEEKRKGEREKEEIQAELYSRVGPLGLKAIIAGKKPSGEATLDFSTIGHGPQRPTIVDMDKVTMARDVYQALSDIEKDKTIMPLLRMRVVDMLKSFLDKRVESAKGNPDRAPGEQTKKWLGKVHEVLKALTESYNKRVTEAAKSDSAGASQALAIQNGGHVGKEAPGERAKDLRTGARDLNDAVLSQVVDQLNHADGKTDMDLASAEAFVNEVLGPNKEVMFDGLAKLVGLRREAEKGKKNFKESYDKLAKELKEKFKFDLDEFCSIQPRCPGAAVACRK